MSWKKKVFPNERATLAAPYGLVAVLAVAQAGCSLVLDAGRDQCATNLDCTSRGAAFATSVCSDSICQPNPTWSCVENAATLGSQKAMVASVEIFDIVSSGPVADAAVALCNLGDFACDTPFNETTTDAQGVARLSLTDNFNGYVQIEKMGSQSTLMFLNIPVVAGEDLGRTPLIPMGGTAFLASQLGVAPAEGRGTVLMQVEDCLGAAAVGAVLAFQGDMSGARPYYSFNGLPSSTAAAVDETGQAGVINAVPGFMGIQASVEGVARTQTSILVRADTVSLVQVRPGYAVITGDF